jgi:hypothetical protein
MDENTHSSFENTSTIHSTKKGIKIRNSFLISYVHSMHGITNREPKTSLLCGLCRICTSHVKALYWYKFTYNRLWFSVQFKGPCLFKLYKNPVSVFRIKNPLPKSKYPGSPLRYSPCASMAMPPPHLVPKGSETEPKFYTIIFTSSYAPCRYMSVAINAPCEYRGGRGRYGTRQVPF